MEKDVAAQLDPFDITVIRVSDTRCALACMSADYFGNPAQKLTTIGITGTKGKTTTTYMVKSVLEKTGVKTGLIGTIEYHSGVLHYPGNLCENGRSRMSVRCNGSLLSGTDAPPGIRFYV